MNSFFTFLFLLVVLVLLIKSGVIVHFQEPFDMLLELIKIILQSVTGLINGEPYQQDLFRELYGNTLKGGLIYHC